MTTRESLWLLPVVLEIELFWERRSCSSKKALNGLIGEGCTSCRVSFRKGLVALQGGASTTEGGRFKEEISSFCPFEKFISVLLGRSLLNDPVELEGTSGIAVATDGGFGFPGELTGGKGQLTSLSSKVTQLGNRVEVPGGRAGCPFMAGLPARQLMASISTSSSSWREEELSVESVLDALPLACSSAWMSCRSVYEGATLGLLVSSEWVVQLLSEVKGHLLKESKEGHVQQGMVSVRAVSL